MPRFIATRKGCRSLATACCLLAFAGCSCRPETSEFETPPAAEQPATERADDETLTTAEQRDPSEDEAAPMSASSNAADDAPRTTKASEPAQGISSRVATPPRESAAQPSSDGSAGLNPASDSITPGEALQEAEGLARRGERAAEAGDTAQAYQHTLAAWRQLQSHRTDAACQRLAAELQARLETLGERANDEFRQNGGDSGNRKPVTIR